MAAAIEVALAGQERTIDVGQLQDGTVFAVMAGAGFDAAMMRDAPAGLKSAIGWPAYLVSGIRSLRRDRIRIEVRLDDQPPLTARVRTVLIANLGRLQGGLDLLPDRTTGGWMSAWSRPDGWSTGWSSWPARSRAVAGPTTASSATRSNGSPRGWRAASPVRSTAT
jgi:hypothetical protein